MKNRVLPSIRIISPTETTPTVSPITQKREISDSFCTSSYGSSFASSFDSDIKAIQELTEVLDQGVKSKLNHYKRVSQDITQGMTSLKEKVQTYEKELDTVKLNVVHLANEAIETTNYIKTLREKELSTIIKSKQDHHSHFTQKIPEVLQKLQIDLSTMKQKIETKEAEYLKNTEDLKASYDFEHQHFYDSSKSHSCACNCTII